MKAISTRLSNIPPSATVAVDNKVGVLRAAGRDIISLGGGDPSFDTPQHIVEAAFKAIRGGATGYAVPSTGTKPAKAAIAAKFERETALSVNPETQIIVTPGGKWAINLALAALINPGDEVLVLEPAWVSFRSMIQLHGGVPVPVSLSDEDNFKISQDSLRAKVSHKTKAIIVNSPCNPTARVLRREEVDALVTIVNQFDLYVVFDELYEQLVFEGQHFPLVSELGMAERTITVNGLSKAYAMTGWRLGWLVAPEPIVKLAAKLHSQTITCATTYGMDALVAALNGPQDGIAEMRDAYRIRRDYMVHALNRIDGIACPPAEGTFFIFPKFTNTTLDSFQIADALLEQADIVSTPGSAFGAAGEGHLRLSIAAPMPELERAVARLTKVVPTL